MSEWKTAGEALARRELRREQRAGVDHFKSGQHGAFVEEGIAYLTYVDQLGHVVNVPCLLGPAEWEPVGVFQRAGQFTVGPLQKLPKAFEFSAEMLTALDTVVSEMEIERNGAAAEGSS